MTAEPEKQGWRAITHAADVSKRGRGPGDGLDSLAGPVCQGRMRLVAVLRNPARIARYLASIGEPPERPRRSPSRRPPYRKSRVLRRMATDHHDDA